MELIVAIGVFSLVAWCLMPKRRRKKRFTLAQLSPPPIQWEDVKAGKYDGHTESVLLAFLGCWELAEVDLSRLTHFHQTPIFIAALDAEHLGYEAMKAAAAFALKELSDRLGWQLAFHDDKMEQWADMFS